MSKPPARRLPITASWCRRFAGPGVRRDSIKPIAQRWRRSASRTEIARRRMAVLQSGPESRQLDLARRPGRPSRPRGRPCSRSGGRAPSPRRRAPDRACASRGPRGRRDRRARRRSPGPVRGSAGRAARAVSSVCVVIDLLRADRSLWITGLTVPYFTPYGLRRQVYIVKSGDTDEGDRPRQLRLTRRPAGTGYRQARDRRRRGPGPRPRGIDPRR